MNISHRLLNGWCVSIWFHCRKVKPKCPMNGHCHLAPMMSFGAWVWLTIQFIYMESNVFITYTTSWQSKCFGFTFRLCVRHTWCQHVVKCDVSALWNLWVRKHKGLSLLMEVSQQTCNMFYSLWLKKFKITFSHTPNVSLQKTFDSSIRPVWIYCMFVLRDFWSVNFDGPISQSSVCVPQKKVTHLGQYEGE